ncbi:hypothetical protein [Rhizobium rhizogenes]|uniref:hypothetical protein n=1 Tax=Rhizobium rhizogenes TaxID=359 RepID=UPI0015725D43|nr:hypothetical protein [Rhizobium rhizogenes]NTF69587.1 restriction endonuclease [Rhizobium rhizogenes]
MAGPRTGQKGPDLEETLKAYFWQSGYFAVRGLPFRLDGEDVTDVDLWLYERPAALTRRRLILDAKNKKVPRAAERLVWAKGLQSALRVDGALVASTDKRQSSRRLAKAMGVTLLDGDAIAKLTTSNKLRLDEQYPSEGFDALFKTVDTDRRTPEWREALLSARAALLTSFGIHSANTALRSAGFFAEQAILAAPRSIQAQTALRGFYSSSAYAAIGLDYVLADLGFRSQDARRAALINGIRYGHTDTAEALATVRAAIGLVRQHAANGNSVAKQVEKGFEEQAANVPAEIVADYVARLSSTETLYAVARELERSAYNTQLAGYDSLSVDAKSLLGVFLDFHDLSREKLAIVGPERSLEKSEAIALIAPVPDMQSLFPDPSDEQEDK